MVHIQLWLAVGAHQVASIVKGWKTSPLNFGTPKAPRGRSWLKSPCRPPPRAKRVIEDIEMVAPVRTALVMARGIVVVAAELIRRKAKKTVRRMMM